MSVSGGQRASIRNGVSGSGTLGAGSSASMRSLVGGPALISGQRLQSAAVARTSYAPRRTDARSCVRGTPMTHPHRLRPDSRRGPGNDSRRGAALVLSLIMVMVCASLGAAFTQLASSAARQQTHEVAQLQAFYVAEAGLAEGFFAVRMGRTGQIASEAVPARFGGADVWVESYTDGDTTFLRSNARRARSDASLALVIRPEPPELGFFSDETLVL